jgi:hypothetical protein
VARVLTGNWFIELGTLAILMIAYNLIRALWGDNASIAIAHAHDVIRAEGSLFDHIEFSLNRWIVTVPSVAIAACYFYAFMHYAMTPLVLFASRRKGGRQYWRGYWALVIACAIALVVYATWPVAPPRLVPGLGVVDVMKDFSSYGWWGGAASAPKGIGDATNQYAAMPSLHFGWSLWCGIQMWGLKSKWWRVPATVYPTVQAVVVLATGNHFPLDVVAGAAVVILAFTLIRLLERAYDAEGDGGRTTWRSRETTYELG